MTINPYSASSSPIPDRVLPARGHWRPLWLGMLGCLVAPLMASLLLIVGYIFEFRPNLYAVWRFEGIIIELRNAALLTSALTIPWVLLLRWRGRLRWRPVCFGAAVLGAILLLVQTVRIGQMALRSDVGTLDMFLLGRGIGLAVFCVPVGVLFGLAAGSAFCLAAGVPVRRTGQ